jgi:hypothetical protein
VLELIKDRFRDPTFIEGNRRIEITGKTFSAITKHTRDIDQLCVTDHEGG